MNFRQFLNRFGERASRIDTNTMVEPEGRDGYLYIENGRKMLVQVELLSGHPGRVIYTSTIDKWLPPHEGKEITDADKERILKKLCGYFDSIGYSYDIE